MAVSAQRIVQLIEEWAPRNLAEEWDNPGWQVGDPARKVKKVLLCLDVDHAVVDEAIAAGADFLISHHPMIYRATKNIRFDQPLGSLVEKLITNGIMVYSAHTNLDSATGGVNDVFAEKLGLKDIQVLDPAHQEKFAKIVVFVPSGHEDKVREALSGAGAGWIGQYSDCTFQVAGTGTFKALEGADPFIGKVDELEKTPEIRLETIVPMSGSARAVKAMIAAHPYEEVAYDLYPLFNEGRSWGLGRVGRLKEAATLGDLAGQVKEILGSGAVRVGGDPGRKIDKVAVCGGAGASLMHKAVFAGADVLITGDIKYHEGRDMVALGLAFIDAGHNPSENIIVPVMATYLGKKVIAHKLDVEIIESQVNTDPGVYF